jgi:hypothetical protein
MKRLRAPSFRATIGALAVLGALLNVWVLTVHITSVALTQLRADGDGVVICHQGGFKYVADLGLGGTKPSSKKHCPICSGLAALHIGVVNEPGVHISLPAGRAMAISEIGGGAVTVDRRLQRILNRGPPLFA